MDSYPEVSWVLYSDDLTLVLEDCAQLEEIIDLLASKLAEVGMKVDHAKTQFIRVGAGSKSLPDTISIKGEDFKVSKFLKFLG